MDLSSEQNHAPVVSDPGQFDTSGGSWLERLIFNHRPVILVLCVVATALLGWHATKLQINASFEKTIPQSHPYIQNFFANRADLRNAGNSIRVAVEATSGTIFDKEYLLTLQKINDTLVLLPGVDRSWMRGLWTSSLRWTEVTEEGYRGGPVMPDRWNGSAESMERLKANIARAGIVGSYVANDMKSSMIVVPLLEQDPDTRAPLDYGAFSRSLEEQVRSLQTDKVRIHIVGFAKVVGDLIDGLKEVMGYFAISVLIATAIVFLYTRCVRSTLLLVTAAALGVVWLLGVMQILGFVLDPYSILVPFLVFAIGLSHGAQKMNGIMQDVGRGMHKYVAARYTFRRLFLAGLTALLANVVGFAVLVVIDIPVIRDMAVVTSLGVTVLIVTKLVLIPVMLSYIGVSAAAARRTIRKSGDDRGRGQRVWEALTGFTARRRAVAAVTAAALLTVGALYVRQGIQIGDLDAGAPELRADSRYNRDAAFVAANYALSGDQFIVMLKTPPGGCEQVQTLVEADRLGAMLRQIPGVLTTFSTVDGVRLAVSGMFEGNPKWLAIPRNRSNLAQAMSIFSADRPDLFDRTCKIMPVIAYLSDHKAGTLTSVVEAVKAFAAEHDGEGREFQMAAGSAGIEAVTNIVVKHSFWVMHLVLYGAVILLCLLTFRSWRAVVVALIPLVITSVLCEALMVWLGIGIKVATLPVIAVGVGVGVDYALYLLSVQLTLQRRGATLAEAYGHALDFTGRIVALVGLTMAAAVVTWAWSPIKFQADMGILLTFMFLWNMVGALVLIPALSHFLLRSEADVPDAPAATPASAKEGQRARRRPGQVREDAKRVGRCPAHRRRFSQKDSDMSGFRVDRAGRKSEGEGDVPQERNNFMAHLPVAWKLVLPLALMLALCGGLALYSLSQMQSIKVEYQGVVDLSKRSRAGLVVTGALRSIGLIAKDIAVEEDPDNLEFAKQDLEEQWALYNRSVDELKSILPGRGADIAAMSIRLGNLIDVVESARQAALAGARAEAQRLVMRVDINSGIAQFDTLAGDIEKAIDAANETADARYRQTVIVTTAAGASGGAIVLLLALLVTTRYVSRPLARIIGEMSRLSGGELSIVVHGAGRRDEVGATARAVTVFQRAMQETAELRTEQEAMRVQAESEKRATLERLAADFQERMAGVVTTVGAAAEQMRHAAGGLASVADHAKQEFGGGRQQRRRGVGEHRHRRLRHRTDVGQHPGDRRPGHRSRLYGQGGDRKRPPVGNRDGEPAERRPGGRRGGEADHRHREPHQPAGPERDHRGGAGGRGRQGLRRRGAGGQGARQPDGAGDAGGRAADRRHAQRHRRGGRGDPEGRHDRRPAGGDRDGDQRRRHRAGAGDPQHRRRGEPGRQRRQQRADVDDRHHQGRRRDGGDGRTGADRRQQSGRRGREPALGGEQLRRPGAGRLTEPREREEWRICPGGARSSPAGPAASAVQRPWRSPPPAAG